MNLIIIMHITYASPAPKANDDLARATFCSEMAGAKNAMAPGAPGGASGSAFYSNLCFQ